MLLIQTTETRISGEQLLKSTFIKAEAARSKPKKIAFKGYTNLSLIYWFLSIDNEDATFKKKLSEVNRQHSLTKNICTAA